VAPVQGDAKVVRIVIISDMHCGHRAGLTPPGYQWSEHGATEARQKFALIQKAMWSWYTSRMDALQPINRLIVNGDAIDGQSKRSGGTELITSDRDEQCDIAQACIEYTRASQVYMTRGTPYHTGQDEDWEDVLAANIDAKHIGAHEWYDAEGVVFDCKHKVSSSVIPHGRNTGPNRDALWNVLWAERNLQPRADVFIRSHVHYHTYSGDARQLVMTTPCLQAASKYGSVQCSGTIDIGFIVFDVEGGEYRWHAELMDMQFMAAQTRHL
jgi:hypothetical protein